MYFQRNADTESEIATNELFSGHVWNLEGRSGTYPTLGDEAQEDEWPLMNADERGYGA
jgi:hypothetical protein